MFLLLSLGSECTTRYPWLMCILKVSSEFQRLLAGKDCCRFSVMFLERNGGEFAHLPEQDSFF